MTFASWFFGKTPVAFCVRGGLLLLVLGLATQTTWYLDTIGHALRTWNAYATHITLDALGVATRLDGNFVWGIDPPVFHIEVIEECTGASVMVILIALTLAYPAPWRARLLGIAGGVLLVGVLNWIRLVSLYLVGRHWSKETYDILHHYVWQGGLILAVFIYWYAWANRVSRTVVAPADSS